MDVQRGGGTGVMGGNRCSSGCKSLDILASNAYGFFVVVVVCLFTNVEVFLGCREKKKGEKIT